MKEQKKSSPLGTLWSWGKAHHGKFVFSIILAIHGLAGKMIRYFLVSCGFDRILREGAFFKPVNSNFP